MTDKLPWMPFYGILFYESEGVGLMDRAEQGTYLWLLWRQWREGSLPSDHADLCRLAGGEVSERVLAMFPEDGVGRRKNEKMETVREHHLAVLEVRALAGREGGLARARSKQMPSKRQANGLAKRLANPSHKEGEVDKDKTSPTTWLTPFVSPWRDRCGGDPPMGRFARSLAPLVKSLGEPEAVLRWTRYLAATEPRFCSVDRFAATHGAYAEPTTREQTDDFGNMRLHRLNATGEWEPVSA